MTKQFSNYSDLLTFTRASKGHALRPVSYGPELVTNGTFDTTIGWTGVASTTDARWYINNGTLTKGGTNGVAEQIANPFVAGKTYLVQFDVTAIPLGVVLVGIGNATHQFTSTGTQSVVLSPTDVSSSLRFFTGGAGGGGVVIDNVSVKEVLFDQPDGTLTLFEHPNNVPRVEYDADGNRLGLLVEEQRTNLVTYSEDFSQWDGLNQMLPFGSGSTVNATTAPNGTLTADLLVPNTTNSNSHFVRDIASVTVGNDYTFSVYVKAAGYTTCSLRLYGTDAPITNFDLSAETTDQSAATITNVGGGWYRCTLTGEATSTGSWYYVYPNQQATFTGDGTSGIYVWGAQVEAGSFPTSYIKSNSGSTTTRSADVASIPVADFGYNQSAGTLFVEIGNHAGATTGSQYVLSLDNDSSAERMQINRFNGNYILDVVDGGASQVSVSVGAGADNSKVAFAYAANDFAATEDGDTPVTDTSGSVPTPTQISIGTAWNLGAPLNGHIKSIKYFPRRLTNAQLVELTS